MILVPALVPGQLPYKKKISHRKKIFFAQKKIPLNGKRDRRVVEGEARGARDLDRRVSDPQGFASWRAERAEK